MDDEPLGDQFPVIDGKVMGLQENMKLYTNDQSDSQYAETSRNWQDTHKSAMESMVKEIKKIDKIKRSERFNPKKKSLFSRIIGAFKFKS